MTIFSTRMMKLLFFGLLLLFAGGASLSPAKPLPAQQLHGEAARDFLAQTGILAQLQAETPPQGRPFLEPAAANVTDVAANALVGTTVAVDGDTLIVGATEAAYVFIRNGSIWEQQQKLVAADGAANDFFGTAVALDGITALVGAFGVDVGGSANNRGAVYVFTRSGANWSQQQKLIAADSAAFGTAVALDGSTALIGAQGAAYVFTGGGASWSQQAKLVAMDGAALDLFGSAVALDGDTALVGADFADVGGKSDQGAAYVFSRSGASWSQQAKLVAGDGAANDQFGSAVALDGDTALVGAAAADVGGSANQGAAYVFSRSGASWSQQAKLVAGDGAANDGFGGSVALDGDTALAGANLANVNGKGDQGAAYVFTRSGVNWGQQQKLVAGDGAAFDRFGIAVALDGDTALVGAFLADVNGQANAGKFYTTTRGLVPWPQTGSSVANDGADGDRFGIAVALDGNTALVGAYFADVGGKSDQGAAYVFTRSGASWSQQAKLVAGDGAAFDLFGVSVALDGDTALVGAYFADVGGTSDQGAAYVFTRSGASWSQQAKLMAADGAAGDLFGHSVALDGDTALVGADYADVGGTSDQGAAYVFTRSGASWSQQAKLAAADGAANDYFGIAVALAGDTALVGADLANVGGTSNQGAAYVFTRSGASWSQQQKLMAGDGAAGDRFGRAVALDGDTALVGANFANVGGKSDQGAAYVFTRSGASWSQQQKLVTADGAANDQLGRAVALDGDTALVGADFAEVGGNVDQGRIFFFERQPPLSANVDCAASEWSVGTGGSLSQAIECFNAKTTAGRYTITLTQDINLTNSTTMIDNSAGGVELLLEGSGFVVDGQGIEGVRPFDINSGAVIIRNVTITGGNGDLGGGIGIRSDGDLSLINSAVINNSANSGGGIYNDGALRIFSSTISGNTAGNDGGGIENQSELWIYNSTISGNVAEGNGGGLRNGVRLEIYSSTINGNAAANQGGGVYSAVNTALAFRNSIIANSGDGGDCVPAGAFILSDFGYNLIEDAANACGLTNGVKNNITGLDPQLGLLVDNGGPTWTHALMTGSPAIDAGLSGQDSDQRGVARPQGVAADIGAFEWEPVKLYLPLVIR